MTTSTTKKTGNPGLLDVALIDYPVNSRILTVGAGKTFSTISAAIAASRDGDVILVDAGTYKNDFAVIGAKITLIGVGGMVNLVATAPPPNLKGILTVNNDVTIKNFSFSGAAISEGDGGNGAGIRYQGGHMVLVNTAFTGNQDGLLATPVIAGLDNVIEIDHSLFSGNGSGSGYTHNLYVNAVRSLVVTNSVFENAKIGHEFKSRAESTLIENNIFRDGPTGTASYDIDLPNGGAAVIRNNVIEKGPQAPNNAMVHYGGESIPYAGSSLLVEGNTFVNDKNSSVIGILNASGIAATVRDNTFDKVSTANLVAGPASLTGNVDQAGKPIADAVLTGIVPGTNVSFTDALAHSVVLSGKLLSVQGGAGRLSVQAINGHVTAVGGSGGMDYQESSGGNQIATAAGSVNSLVLAGGDTIDSRGTDRIKAGTGNLKGQISGTATIDDSPGDDTWTINGTAALIGHGGAVFAGVGAKGSMTVTGTLAALQVQNNGGNMDFDAVIAGTRMSASIVGGAYTAQTYANQINMTTAAGSQGAVVRMGAGNAQIVSAGKDVIWAGSGSATVIVSGQAEVHAGTGALSVYGRSTTSAGATVYGNGGAILFGGDTGNITYYGGDRASTVQARLDNIRLIGGAGRMTVNGGSRETIVGGAGGLTYDAQGGGANMITTAAGSTNSLILSGGANVDSWGKDTIFGGGGNQNMTVHGDAVITGSTGDSYLTLMGNDVLNGRGYDQVTVTQGANVTINAGRLTAIREADAKVMVTTCGSGAGSAFVEGGAANIVGRTGGVIGILTDVGRSTKVTLGAGSGSVQSQGSDQIYGGAGNAVMALSGANAEIWAGSGEISIENRTAVGVTETIHGGKGSIHVSQWSGTTNYIGGSGAAVLDGGYGSLNVLGGSGAISITNASRGLRFIGGSGDATIALEGAANDITFGSGNTTAAVTVSWGQANTFHFLAGHGGGADIIKGFRVGTDCLDLHDVGIKSQSVSGGSTNFVLTDDTHLQLVGVTNTTKLFA